MATASSRLCNGSGNRRVCMATGSLRLCNGTGNRFHLPEHLFDEILLRLPVESLLRFKLVCKSWLSLIKSPGFVNRHCRRLRHIKNDDRIIVMYGGDPPPGHDSPIPPIKVSLLSPQDDVCLDLDFHLPGFHPQNYFADFRMLCFDGIICLYFLNHFMDLELFRVRRSYDYPVVGPAMYIYLWNPATKKIRALPQPPTLLPVSDENLSPVVYVSISFGLECDHNLLPSVYVGFGFNLKTKDYKVVRIVLSNFVKHVVECRVEVYSLCTDSWRTIDVVLPVEEIISNIKEPIRNGRIFCWSGRKVRANNGELDDHLILWFDFCNEEFGTIPFPDSIRHNCNMKLAITRDDNIISINYLENGRFEVWMMSEFGVKESWTNLYNVQPCWEQMVSPLSDGESFLVLKERRLCIYNTVTQETKELSLQKDFFDEIRLNDIRYYKESLVSVETGNQGV